MIDKYIYRLVVRQGRTGEAFMKIAKTGKIQDFCQPNALLTLQEYMQVSESGGCEISEFA